MPQGLQNLSIKMDWTNNDSEDVELFDSKSSKYLNIFGSDQQ